MGTVKMFQHRLLPRLGKSPQNFLVQPGMPEARQWHLLHASCQLSPGWRRAPLASAPQPDRDWGKAEAPTTRTQTSRRLFMLVVLLKVSPDTELITSINH